ncbi:peptide/nickel transport system substrate-binding protein [Abditibacterium utsteinense]|uniref:Peptide/nickel transport system substrate-binding protein n=1 Tax=Abditibacterium utsteinense TaxID=1960156 RepID=A0A2S8ST06_9BACT|nr:ABC transporter substrate-binding protein [Abditibacterium utsteinense]PQV63925.1 peptide/nickel transport system substrate-binding protein [Abditibacterium utsteinense]
MRQQRLHFLWLSPVFALSALAGCGGQEKFADSNVAVSDSGADKDLVDAQNGKVSEPASVPGKYGGTFTDTQLSDPKTFNIWVSADAGSTSAASPLLSSLIERNMYTLEWQSALCELPTVSADGKTWVFKLKDGLKWSDGVPMTADDIIFTLDVIFDEKVQTNMRESMKIDVPDGKGGFKREPFKYRKIDARSVEFKLPVPYAPARDILSIVPAPKHVLEAAYKKGGDIGFTPAWGVDADPKTLVSSGPWIMTSYVPGQRIVYGRNPHFWRKDKDGRQLPYLERLVSIIVPDINTQTLKFLGNETDVLGVPQNDYQTVKKQEKTKDFTLRNLGPTDNTSYFSFNLNMKSQPAKANPQLFKLFNDVRFRRAISHAIDRDKIARNVYRGLARPGYGPETPANKLFYNAETPRFDFNLDKARALLQEIGLKDGNGDGILELSNGQPVKFSVLTNVENKLRVGQGTIITDDLKKIGVDATLTPLNFNALISRVDNQVLPNKPYPPFNWHAIILGFTGGIEPHNGVNIWRSSGNLHQWEPYQTKPTRPWEAEIDTLFRQGAQQLDEKKRQTIYFDWQRIVGEEQPLIYTVVPDSLIALRNRFGNVKPSATGGVTWNQYEMFDLKATKDSP